MDRGQVLKSEFTVVPGINGSFVINLQDGRIVGFSNAYDLVRFVEAEAEAILKEKQAEN
jgi:hypothetical protein